MRTGVSDRLRPLQSRAVNSEHDLHCYDRVPRGLNFLPSKTPREVPCHAGSGFPAGRCIIFTTHYLEEADILANRKAGSTGAADAFLMLHISSLQAVLARGKVQAVGTSRELKHRFASQRSQALFAARKPCGQVWSWLPPHACSEPRRKCAGR